MVYPKLLSKTNRRYYLYLHFIQYYILSNNFFITSSTIIIIIYIVVNEVYCIEMYVFCSRSSHSIVVKGVRSVIVNGCSSTSSIDLRGLYVVEWWELRRSGGEHHTGWMQILSRTFSSLQLVLFLPHLETCRVWKTEMVIIISNRGFIGGYI